MTRLVLALAFAVAVPAAAHASEKCYYRNAAVHVCRDPEYRACVLYGAVGATDFAVGHCPPPYGIG